MPSWIGVAFAEIVDDGVNLVEVKTNLLQSLQNFHL